MLMRAIMVLSEGERECAAALLRYVPDSDLESIAMTVSKGMVTPTSTEECLKIIIYHSESPKTLLSRKKITKEILFKYLSDNNVSVDASAGKHDLQRTVIMLWNHFISKASGQDMGQVDGTSGLHMCMEGTSQQLLKQQTNHVVPLAAGASCSESAMSGVTADEVNELAVKFSEWFYKLLNAQDQEEEKLGPEHFWQDCTVLLVMISPSNVVEVAEKNAEHVAKLLQNTQRDHKLYFNPNLSVSGVKGKLDPHGLVIVFACGTLHQVQNCVGVFEQMFLLARDPFSSNHWKVKSTKLRLKSGAVQGHPALQEESISQLMALPDHRNPVGL